MYCKFFINNNKAQNMKRIQQCYNSTYETGLSSCATTTIDKPHNGNVSIYSILRRKKHGIKKLI